MQGVALVALGRGSATGAGGSDGGALLTDVGRVEEVELVRRPDGAIQTYPLHRQERRGTCETVSGIGAHAAHVQVQIAGLTHVQRVEEVTNLTQDAG